jgi:pimeloyl-ACP methyl ester carboxylesterase
MSSVDVLTVGKGPGLIVLPGGTRRAHHYRALAEALADTHTVHVVDRRRDGDFERQVTDAAGVLDGTDSAQIFGHSFGGLIALHVGLRRDLTRLIAYEPGVSLHGSIPAGSGPAIERLLSRGKDATATVTFLHTMGFIPGGPAAIAMMWLMQRLTRSGRELRSMMPTVPPELRAIGDLDSDGSRYAAITAPTLLLGGGRSPAYLKEVLPPLAEIIPDAKLVITDQFDHNAPDLSDPKGVARLIRA